MFQVNNINGTSFTYGRIGNITMSSAGGTVTINGVTYRDIVEVTLTSTGKEEIVLKKEDLGSSSGLQIDITGDAETVKVSSGKVRLSGNASEVSCTSGDIAIKGNVNGDVRATSGDIQIGGHVGGKASVTSGNVKCSGCRKCKSIK